MFGQGTSFSTIKVAFREKREFYSIYYNDNFKDPFLFKKT